MSRAQGITAGRRDGAGSGVAAGAGCWAAAALLLVLMAGCASIEAPRGGPEDRDPPIVLAAEPDSGAVGVALEMPLRFFFSERMDRSSVQDWLQIAPWPSRLGWQWQAEQVAVLPEDGWAPEETYSVLLGTQASDRRKNRLEQPFELVFSTGDSLPTGRLAGRVLTRSLAASGHLVALFRWPPEAPDPRSASFGPPDVRSALRLAESGEAGRFELRHLPRVGQYLLGALHDEAGNRTYESDRDLWVFHPEPVAGSDFDSDEPVEIHLVYADEPGDLAGSVIDSVCLGYEPPTRLRAAADSLQRILAGELDAQGFETGEDSAAAFTPAAAFTLSAAEAESLQARLDELEPRIRAAQRDSARCSAPIWVKAVFTADVPPAVAPVTTAGPPPAVDPAGLHEVRTMRDFRLTDLPAGVYRLRAYRDLNGSGAQDPAEPAGTFAYPVELLPGRTIEGLEFEIRTAERDADPPAGERDSLPPDAGDDRPPGASDTPVEE